MFGINKSRSDQMPYFGAKDPCLGAFVQQIRSQLKSVTHLVLGRSNNQARELNDVYPDLTGIRSLQLDITLVERPCCNGASATR